MVVIEVVEVVEVEKREKVEKPPLEGLVVQQLGPEPGQGGGGERGGREGEEERG